MLDHLTTRQKVALAVALPASMVLIYLLFKSREDDDVSRSSSSLAAGQRQSITMSIPHDKVGALIGREGCNIKQIQSESGAQVKFQDETQRGDKSDRHVRIHGNRESVLLAERLILEFLADQPEIVTKVLMIPQQAIGRIIGRQGSNIRKIQMESKARVKIDRETEGNSQTLRTCTITGTLQQVDLAEYKIREEVNAAEDYQQRLADAASKRQQRPTGKSAKNMSTSQQPSLVVQTAPEPEGQWTAEESLTGHSSCPPTTEPLPTIEPLPTMEPPRSKDFFTVFVSAVEHPGHFWLQMVNSKAQELDLLRENMTDFYNQPENIESFKPDNIQLGEVLAAPFAHDQSWYRARVLGFLDNDMLDLYYLDYGDCASMEKARACSLRDDFLSLPFQAVEFSLANVAPIGDEWSEAAITHFEQLTKVAQWKPMSAKIINYKTTENGTIPCVELYDISGDNEIIISKELRYGGYAMSDKAKEREMVGNGTERTGASGAQSNQTTGNGARS